MSVNAQVSEQDRVYDNLVLADFPITTRKELLISGQNLVRGAALGKITASGKLTLLDSGAGDGSNAAFAILVNDTDASGGDVNTSIYLTGKFNEADMLFTTGDTAAQFRDAFRALGIITETAQ